jgi:hypothetical protein
LVRQKNEFEETIKKIDKAKFKRAQSSMNVLKLGFGAARAQSIPMGGIESPVGDDRAKMLLEKKKA